MAKLDTVKKIKELNGQTVSVELSQRQLDDLELLAKEGEAGLEAFNQKHIEYNDTLDEDEKLDLSHLKPKTESTNPPTNNPVPEGESARTVTEQKEEEQRVEEQKALTEERNQVIQQVTDPAKAKTLQEVRQQLKDSAREKIARSDSRLPPPEITEGPKVKVRPHPNILRSGGMLYDASTRTKIVGEQEVIRSPYVSRKIAVGDLVIVE